MLNKYIVIRYVSDGGRKTVWFKYTSEQDFKQSASNFVKLHEKDFEESRKRGLEVAASKKYDFEKYKRLRSLTNRISTNKNNKQTRLDYYKPVTDLDVHQDYVWKLFKAFRLATRAAERAKIVFEGPFLDSPSVKKILLLNSPFVKIILKKCFGDPNMKDEPTKTTIARTFDATYRGLNGDCVVFADVAGRVPQVAGYVNMKRSAKENRKIIKKNKGENSNNYKDFMNRLRPVDFSNIHINFKFCKDHSVGFIARTMLHESTHKYANTTDPLYPLRFENTYAGESWDKTKKNADSYAVAGMSLLKNKFMTEKELEKVIK
jgi:hypothetical protein